MRLLAIVQNRAEKITNTVAVHTLRTGPGRSPDEPPLRGGYVQNWQDTVGVSPIPPFVFQGDMTDEWPPVKFSQNDFASLEEIIEQYKEGDCERNSVIAALTTGIASICVVREIRCPDSSSFSRTSSGSTPLTGIKDWTSILTEGAYNPHKDGRGSSEA
ncbi:hypothetical protein B0H11DRAFT_1932596 [Mycena galericulata]|nr:hypothetical protein B0H11DRAFT_1932596 [Mycena galericulata]